jgi:hypothetical protein
MLQLIIFTIKFKTMKSKSILLLFLGLLIGGAIGWYFGQSCQKPSTPGDDLVTVPVDQARAENTDYILMMKGQNPAGQFDLTAADAQQLGLLLQNIDMKKRYSLVLGYQQKGNQYLLNLLSFTQSGTGDWTLDENDIKVVAPVYPCPPTCDRLNLNWNTYPVSEPTKDTTDEEGETDEEQPVEEEVKK